MTIDLWGFFFNAYSSQTYKKVFLNELIEYLGFALKQPTYNKGLTRVWRYTDNTNLIIC